MYDVRDIQLLQEALARYELLINRPLLQELSRLCSCPSCNQGDSIQLIQIKNWPASSTPANFQFIFNALGGLHEVIGYLLDFTENNRFIYVGIKGDSSYALKLLQEGLTASFPGIELEEIPNSAELLNTFFCAANYCQIACVTVIPNTTLSTALLTTFTNLMGPTATYHAFFLAHPYPRHDLLCYLEELCELYHILSVFTQTNVSHAKGLAKNSSTTIANGETVTRGNSHTQTNGTNMTLNHAGYTNVTVSTGVPLPALNNQNINLSYLLNQACGTNQGNTDSLAKGDTYSLANSHTNNRLSAENRTDNNSMSYTSQNKCVQNALITLSDFITRIQALLKTTTFQYGAYFFAPSSSVTIRAAYSFMGLAANPSPYLGPSVVNTWDAHHPEYQAIFDSLVQFNHPRFCTSSNDQTVTATTFIQSVEFLNSFYLPNS